MTSRHLVKPQAMLQGTSAAAVRDISQSESLKLGLGCHVIWVGCQRSVLDVTATQ